MNTTPRTLSFVIPVRNDAARLRRCLETIRQGTPRGTDVEILVADNGSTDDSVQVATDAGTTVMSLPGVRLGELRNRGAAGSKGDILAFVDADHEIGPAWIACAIAAFDTTATAAIGAPYDSPAPATWVQRLYDSMRRHPVAPERVTWLGSGNMAVRRSAFEEVGGFDTTLETCEDVDLCRKLRARGYALMADQRMGSIHHGDPRTLGQVFFGELWRGRDNIRVSLRAPRSGRTLLTAALPLASLIAAGLAMGGALTGSPAGLRTSAAALGYLVLVIGLRASAMIHQSPLTDWPKAWAVAAAYEAGRALAVTGRFGYRRRRPAAVA